MGTRVLVRVLLVRFGANGPAPFVAPGKIGAMRERLRSGPHRMSAVGGLAGARFEPAHEV